MAKNKVNDGTLETIPGQSGEPEIVKEKQADDAELGVQKEEAAACDLPEAKKEIGTPKPRTVKEKANEVVDEFAQKTAKKYKEQSDFIAPYAKAYPKEKAFCVTSDWQVFLEKDRGLAVLHQNSLGNGEKVQTLKVK